MDTAPMFGTLHFEVACLCGDIITDLRAHIAQLIRERNQDVRALPRTGRELLEKGYASSKWRSSMARISYAVFVMPGRFLPGSEEIALSCPVRAEQIAARMPR